MAASTVRVEGLREFQRDMRKIQKDLAKEVREELRDAAMPVRDLAQELFSAINPRSAAGYKVRVRGKGVAVEQSKRRTTGQHPEFGRWQIGLALIPALEQRSDDVIDALGDMIERLSDRHGFH